MPTSLALTLAPLSLNNIKLSLRNSEGEQQIIKGIKKKLPIIKFFRQIFLKHVSYFIDLLVREQAKGSAKLSFWIRCENRGVI